MIDPEEYRDLVEENTMLWKELKAAKEENARLKEDQRYPKDSEDIGPCSHWNWPGG